MKILSFLSKLAFICNACFLVAIMIQLMPHPPDADIVSVIIILGYVVAAIVNIIVNLCYAFLLFSAVSFRNIGPLWLIITNFLFLILQLILFLK